MLKGLKVFHHLYENGCILEHSQCQQRCSIVVSTYNVGYVYWYNHFVTASSLNLSILLLNKFTMFRTKCVRYCNVVIMFFQTECIIYYASLIIIMCMYLYYVLDIVYSYIH